MPSHERGGGANRPASLTLPKGLATAQLIAAVMCAGPQAFARGWRPHPEGAAFRLGSGRGMIILRSAGEPEARELLRSMSVLTLDALLVALDLLSNGRRWVAIDAADVLAAKGYRRWGEERSAFELRVMADLLRLGRLCWRSGAAAEPLLVMAPQHHNSGFLLSAGPALARCMRRGPWHALAWTVLELDHRHSRGSDALAKKLAVALALRGPGAPLRTRDLLVSVGELDAHGREPRQARVVERLRAAADRLRDLNLYHLELGPILARRKGWVTTWLQCDLEARPYKAVASTSA